MFGVITLTHLILSKCECMMICMTTMHEWEASSRSEFHQCFGMHTMISQLSTLFSFTLLVSMRHYWSIHGWISCPQTISHLDLSYFTMYRKPLLARKRSTVCIFPWPIYQCEIRNNSLQYTQYHRRTCKTCNVKFVKDLLLKSLTCPKGNVFTWCFSMECHVQYHMLM